MSVCVCVCVREMREERRESKKSICGKNCGFAKVVCVPTRCVCVCVVKIIDTNILSEDVFVISVGVLVLSV